jgi:fluoroquinolone transport system permease protein
MSTLAVYRSLGAIDTRNVARDPMLRWVVILTPAFGVFLRFALPPMATALHARFGFDLVTYYPLVMSLLPLVVVGMVGTVVGFLLLDQRDDQTMTALLVTPLSLGDYLRYRLTGLTLLAIAFSCMTVPLAGLTETTVWQVVVTSIVAAPLAPVYALFLGSFAGNKVQGFALAKIMGIVLVPCIVAYSVTSPWQSLFGLVPHYWPMKVYWLFEAGAAGSALVHAVIGLVWQAAVLTLLLHRFARVVRR